MVPEDHKRKMLRLPTGISRNTVLLGLVSFLNDFSADMIHPHLLAVFLSSVLGVSTAAIGLIGGIAEATASALKPLSGWLSDALRRRRPAILLGYWIAVCSRPLLALSTSMWHVLGLRFADRVGKGARTAPRDALIADSTPEGYRGKAFGLHRALDTAGAALGMLIAALLLLFLGTKDLPVTLRTIFVIASVPGVMVVGLIVWGVREQPELQAHAARKPPLSHVRNALTPGLVKWYAVVFLFWLGNSSDMFLILKANDLSEPFPLWQIPLLVFTTSVVHALLSTPAGALSDRIGRRGIIVSGWLLYALVYAGFAFADTHWMMYALFGLYGVYYALTEGVERALVADLAPAASRATALGLYHFVVGGAALPASVIVGLLWQWGALGRYSTAVALGFGASCALAGVVLLLILNPRPTPAGAQKEPA